MKFDYVIGNPPYQEESETESTTNGQKPRKNIFQHFQLQADEIATESSVLIYPGGRWMHQSGKGLKQFGKDLINDKRLATVEFYPNSREVFGAADISDGVTIVTKRQTKNTDGFEYIYSQNGTERRIKAENPGENLMPLNPNDVQIVRKISEFVSTYQIGYLHDAILPRSLFSIESDYVEKNPDKVREFVEGETIDEDREIKMFTNDKAGSAGRSKWFVTDKSIVTQNEKYVHEWQVVVSSAHAGGQEGRDNQISIVDNKSIFGRARVALRSFETYDEAKNFFEFANTFLIKYAFLMTDEALSSLGKRVPDILNYKSDNGIIDFTEELNAQLYRLLDLTEEEVRYIEEVVNKSAKKKGDGVDE